MFDLIIGIGESFIKHGVSLSFIGAALFVVLKQRPSKRWIRKHFPRLLQDDADVMNYEARQIRIENDVRAIKAHLGVKECVERPISLTSMEKPLLRSSQVVGLSARSAVVLMRRALTIISRGNRTMRAYLKKLSRTKLQAYLLATIMNIALLVGYVMDIQDIQSKVEAWMPMANMTVQTVLTLIYVWVEGSIDKEQVKAQNPEVKIGDSGPAED